MSNHRRCVIQFGAAEPLAAVALRGALGGKFAFRVPRFGPRCVCCNTDAMGRTQDFDASTDRVESPPVPMPVCFACAPHALASTFAAIMQACLLVVGGATAALGWMKLDERPDDSFLWWMMGVGAVLVVLATGWALRVAAKERAGRQLGHHPGLIFSIEHGRTVLSTTNATLADELLGLNPDSRRLR